MTSRTAANPLLLSVFGLSALLAACAGFPTRHSAPAQPAQVPPPPQEVPAPSPEPPPPPVPALPESHLLCTVQEARRISFADLGIPAGSRPIDAALGPSTVWVLFEPSLLVGIPRGHETREPAAVAEYGAMEEVAMVPGPRPDAWRSLAVDGDGTLWLVSPSGLWRMRPGRRAEPVIAAKASGFGDVVAGRGAVWVAPICSADAIWKLDSKGKVLATALRRTDATAKCAGVDFERDWSGDVWAVRPSTGETFRLAFDGKWLPAGEALPVPLPPAGEQLLSWFFWGPEPLALGGTADEAVLYRRVDGRVTGFHEDCGDGNALVRVAGDARGWAALTRSWLLLGEHRRPGVGSDAGAASD